MKRLPRPKNTLVVRLSSRRLEVTLTALQGGFASRCKTAEMKVEVRGGGSDCGKGQPLTLPGRDGEVSQVKKGEPATESQYRAARHGGAATLRLLYSVLAADHLEPGKGTVQRVERRSTTLHHFLKGSDGLSRLLCGSPACSGIMRPCCRRPSTVLQAYVCALLLLLSVKADGEFWICYLFFSSGLVLAPRCLTQSYMTRLRGEKKRYTGFVSPPPKKTSHTGRRPVKVMEFKSSGRLSNPTSGGTLACF